MWSDVLVKLILAVGAGSFASSTERKVECSFFFLIKLMAFVGVNSSYRAEPNLPAHFSLCLVGWIMSVIRKRYFLEFLGLVNNMQGQVFNCYVVMLETGSQVAKLDFFTKNIF